MPPLCRQGRLSIAILLLLPPITLAIDPSSKRGLAWPNGNYVPISTFDTSNTSISSYYTWSPDPISDSPFPFIPMLWGANETYIDPFNTALNESFWNVSLTAERVLLGFNEPDNVGQSNVSPSEGAATWINVLEPLKREGYRLGSPAITSAPSGKNWLLDWWDECAGGCNPDFVVLHWYNLRADDFIDYLTDFYNTFGLPIWVTGEPGQADLEGQLTPSIEYAVQDFSDNSTVATLAEIQNFMNLTTAFMEATEWVERYFWFGAMYDMQGVNDLDSLYDLDSTDTDERTGKLSALGEQYLGTEYTLTSNGVRIAEHWRLWRSLMVLLILVSVWWM